MNPEKMKLNKKMSALLKIARYDKNNFKYDFRSGVSVAAVALPIAIAYTALMGINPVVGLYACILPMFVYAIIGTSPQLIIGPDAATCAVITATITPLAFGNENILWQLAIIMTLMMGGWCLIASYFHLAIFADFLSKPILDGLLNSVAIIIIVGQLGVVTGIETLPTAFIKCITSLPGKLGLIKASTLFFSLSCLCSLFVVKKLLPFVPEILVVVSVSTILSWYFDFNEHGISIIGNVNRTLPVINIKEHVGFNSVISLIFPSLNLAIISIVSFMMTVRNFASKNNYEIDVGQELKSLAYVNIISGLSQGYAVSAATSRTAINDACKGKTQLVSIISVIIMVLVMIFFIPVIGYIPHATLGVILIYSGWSMLNLRDLFLRHRNNHSSYILTLFTISSVLIIGIVEGIGFALLLGILQFLRNVFRPTDSRLGIDKNNIVRELDGRGDVKEIAHVMLYRFDSMLTYFNVSYFQERLLKYLNCMSGKINWVVVDANICFTYNDCSVFSTLHELITSLEKKEITLVLAGRCEQLTKWLVDNDFYYSQRSLVVVPDLYYAIRIIKDEKLSHEILIQKMAMGINLQS